MTDQSDDRSLPELSDSVHVDGVDSSDQDPLAGAMASALGGGLDFGAMMQAAQSMQTQMESAQAELADARVVGTSGGELVSVTLNGHLHLISVVINPAAIDPDDPSIVEDLVQAAWQDAHDQVAVLQQQADPMSGFLGGGGSLGSLGDLFGGS